MVLCCASLPVVTGLLGLSVGGRASQQESAREREPRHALPGGRAELDELAVRTFERWRFSPAARVGIPVKVRMTAEVKFHG
jgi:hypothetical protein